MSASEPRAIDGTKPGLALASHGARLGVFTDDARCFAGLEARLPVGCVVEQRDATAGSDGFDASFWLETASRRVRTDGAPAAFRLRDEAGELETGPALAPLHDRLVSELHFAVATHARSAIFVHAGVVGWRGRAIVVPGRSMSGKTTLTRALVESGADYYSDEYAVIDEAGAVHAYPRPLGVRRADGHSEQVAPETLGGRIGGPPLPVGLIVQTRYVEGARFAPERSSSARGLLALIDNTVVVRERSGFALDRLTPAARGAVALAGERGDAMEAAAHLLSLSAEAR